MSYCTPVSSSHVTPCPPSQIGDQENAFAPLVSQYSTWSATWQLDDATSLLAGALSVHRGVCGCPRSLVRGGSHHAVAAGCRLNESQYHAPTEPRTRPRHALDRAAHRTQP